MADFRRERDVIIVGAGPAGASTAYYLAKQGLDVLVVEEKTMPRPKSCGDGVGPRAVLALQDIGLEDWLESSGGYRVDRLRIVASSGASITSTPEPDLFPIVYGYVIPREVFDQKLADHARGAGAEIVEGFAADDVTRERGRITGVSGNVDCVPTSVRAKLTVAADGSKGKLSRRFGPALSRPKAIGLRTYAKNISGIDDCANIYFTRKFPKGYAWIFPTGDESANVGVGLLGLDHGGKGQDIHLAFDHMIDGQDLSPASLDKSAVTGRPVGSVMRMNFGQRPIHEPGLAFVGDAAGLVSPINGEGISHAIESGKLLAEELAGRFGSAVDLDQGLERYNNTMRRRFLAYFRWGRLFDRVFGSQARLDKAIAKAQNDDYLRIILAGVLANTVHPRELARAKLILKVLF